MSMILALLWVGLAAVSVIATAISDKTRRHFLQIHT